VAQALFDPPPFRADKLSIVYQDVDKASGQRLDAGRQADGSPSSGPSPAPSGWQRRYTLTHNDITGDLQLTVGREYNYAQISGLYTRLLRDEVVAEWVLAGPTAPSLHVYCHVSGEERWLAPPPLRNYIFRRELPLVRGCKSTCCPRMCKLCLFPTHIGRAAVACRCLTLLCMQTGSC
jgi:hypothetical protein